MRVPRHLFIDPAFDTWAYKDVAFPIDADQTISQPYTVAMQSSLLEIRGKEKVLEIGTGSGYQAAVLVEMGCKVYSIERQERLYHKTSKLLQDIGYYQIRTKYGDGYKGWPRFAPFDRIIVTAGAPDVPNALKEQLTIGGIMVIPVGSGDDMEMWKVVRTSESKWTMDKYGKCSFVPFLKGTQS